MGTRHGILFVVAGPSGVGKGSVLAELLGRGPGDLELSVSVTTRPMREGEQDGRDYHFVAEDRFDEMAAGGDLYEWAEVFGYRYGTPRSWVEQRLAEGADVLLEIDVQGAAQVRERRPDAVLILLEPPSLQELERRLRTRGTESDERIRARLQEAEAELGRADEFDHRIVNDQVPRAADEVAAIIEASRIRASGDAGAP